jgi:sialidase-1
MTHRLLVGIAALVLTATARTAEPISTALFTAGEGDYHTYRTPSLIVGPKGAVLAFCEGRKDGPGDTGDIDLVLRRSTDGGKTWGKLEVIWDDGPNTCGNPCPVVDARTGTIWLLLTHNLGKDTEKLLVSGKGEGTPKDVHETGSAEYATGPGVGIQLRSGRLLIPCDSKSENGTVRESHVILSDDGGKTWKLGGVVGPDCNECQAVELSDGSVMLNMRTFRANNRRLVSVSKDGGTTFSKPREDETLIEPVCQASILRLPPGKTGDKPAVLFSNPASTKREKITVRLSTDDGKTWLHAKDLHPGPAAYSCLTVLSSGDLACLYERGAKNPYETITLARFTREWLEGE